MRSHAELQRFLEQQNAAESILLADVEAAAEFSSARSAGEATVSAAQGDQDWDRQDETEWRGGLSASRVGISPQGGR